jgi:hypothetical protein|tara:strand:+ start:193 stop:849 length:657 start_codon:yes stop_codon:yes gene_type:complete
MIDEKIQKILIKYNIDQEKALWDCHGTQIMYHRYIEEIGAVSGVQVIKYETIKADESTAIVKCHARLGKVDQFSYGECSPRNSKNAYPVAMAEKRAFDRCVLKLVGLHGHIYAISEMPDEESILKKMNHQNNSTPKVQPKTNGKHEGVDNLLIHTSLEKIQNGIDKGEFKNLSFKVEKLKTLIHKAGFWDSFTKTNEFKRLNKMNLIIKTHITKQRRN